MAVEAGGTYSYHWVLKGWIGLIYQNVRKSIALTKVKCVSAPGRWLGPVGVHSWLWLSATALRAT
jgi:hypothetical protein